MFYQTTLKTHVRVPPDLFAEETKTAILNRLNDQFEGFLSSDIGAIIAGGIVFFGIGAIRRAIFQGEMGAIKEGGRKIAARGQLLHELQKEELDKSYGKEAAGN